MSRSVGHAALHPLAVSASRPTMHRSVTGVSIRSTGPATQMWCVIKLQAREPKLVPQSPLKPPPPPCSCPWL